MFRKFRQEILPAGITLLVLFGILVVTFAMSALPYLPK